MIQFWPQALGDRLAEAYAEKLHLDVRTTIWGYAASEKLDADDLLKVHARKYNTIPGITLYMAWN